MIKVESPTLEKLCSVIESQRILGIADIQSRSIDSLSDAALTGIAEVVRVDTCPLEPTYSANRLNKLGAELDEVMPPSDYMVHSERTGMLYDERQTMRNFVGMLVGVRKYAPEPIELVSFGIQQAVQLHRQVELRIFPNIRLAAEASRGEIDSSWITNRRIMQSKRDYKKFGHFAVYDL